MHIGKNQHAILHLLGREPENQVKHWQLDAIADTMGSRSFSDALMGLNARDLVEVEGGKYGLVRLTPKGAKAIGIDPPRRPKIFVFTGRQWDSHVELWDLGGCTVDELDHAIEEAWENASDEHDEIRVWLGVEVDISHNVKFTTDPNTVAALAAVLKP